MHQESTKSSGVSLQVSCYVKCCGEVLPDSRWKKIPQLIIRRTYWKTVNSTGQVQALLRLGSMKDLQIRTDDLPGNINPIWRITKLAPWFWAQTNQKPNQIDVHARQKENVLFVCMFRVGHPVRQNSMLASSPINIGPRLGAGSQLLWRNRTILHLASLNFGPPVTPIRHSDD